MQKLLLFTAIIFSLFSCAEKPVYSPEIEVVLCLAGDNRAELEKVLQHYSHDPADSLKLCAAEFLIVNMPNKYSEYYDAAWNDVATAMLRWTSSSDKQKVIETYCLGEPVRKEDILYITADFLISNIELAFQSWQDKAWGKYISFETFCEEILPYRIGTEPLEKWREKVLTTYADINKTFQEDTAMTAVAACTKMNETLPKFSMDKDFPPMSYSQLMASRKGDCDKQITLTLFVMRALGIPVSYEYTPKWFNEDVGHSWNAVCDSAGKHLSFMGMETPPFFPHMGNDRPKTKVYRLMFARQRTESADTTERFDWEIQKGFVKDVSLEYGGFEKVKIPAPFALSDTAKIYLATRGVNDWHVTGAAGNDSLAIFKKMLYLPVQNVGGELVPSNFPFIAESRDSVRFFAPDTTKMQLLTLKSIAPYDPHWFARMLGGRFEGANKVNFSDAVLLHKIAKAPDDRFEAAKIGNKRKFRYFRYMAQKGINAHCNVAEIKLFGGDSILTGTPIGTKETYPTNPTMNFDKVFDGDVTTFFDALDDNSWTGLDFGEPKKISEIHYLPRNIDSKGIYAGHIYELFYHNAKGWQSLGKCEATIAPLQFSVPANALFYLKNHTTGKSGVIFIVENGQQKWVI